MRLPPIKSSTKAEIDAAAKRKREREIEQDIRKIDDVLQKADPAEMEALHRYLDGKYQSGVMDWGHACMDILTDMVLAMSFSVRIHSKIICPQ